MNTARVEKVVFVISFAALAWMYGFATSARGWFPNDLLVRAWDEARALGTTAPDWMVSRVYEGEGVRLVVPGSTQQGLTLVSTNLQEFDWLPGLVLIDHDGAVHHQWRVDPSEIFADSANVRRWNTAQAIVNGSHLFPNGDVLVNLDYLGTVRLDACGRVRWRLAEGNHHSITPAEDGTFWIPALSRKGPAVTPDHPDGLPGIRHDVYQDRILQVSADGQILRDINVFDVLYANGLQRHIPKASWKRDRDDITHLNDVEPLPAALADQYPLFEAGNLVVSLRHLDLVMVLDPQTERVKWHETRPFLQQHDPDFIGDGWIGVFDNNYDGTERGTMLGGSRIVAVQPHTDSVAVLFPTEVSEPFYTETVGQWQRLANGNLLLTETHAARVVEVTADGRTVWDWVATPRSKSAVPEVPDATRYELTPEEIDGWPCSPETGQQGSRVG